ncbi:cupin domain-containing protein [Pedobacter frigoris]|nr:cupin domain-containing protein [Pedobacter frigoris]
MNDITGQKIKIIGTIDDVLEMETVYPSFSEEPPMHFHPKQQEYFEVLEGELTVRYKDKIKHYEKGSIIHIQAKQAHAMWNSGFTPAKVTWKVKPALATEKLLRETFKLANDGRTDQFGKPYPLVLIYLLKKYSGTFRLARPKFIVIMILYVLFSPIYYFCNYKRNLFH